MLVLLEQNEYDTNDGPRLLMVAARDGVASRVQTLLSASDMQFYINYTDKDGRTSLFTSASEGHVPMLEKLIDTGSNINLRKTTDGTSPLLIASQRGHFTVVEQLIVSQRRSCIDIPVIYGSTALSLATHNGHTRIVTMIHACLNPCTVCKKYGHDPTG